MKGLKVRAFRVSKKRGVFAMLKQISFLISGLVWLAACAVPEKTDGRHAQSHAAVPHETSFDGLRTASCLDGERPQRAQAITIQAKPIALGGPDAVAAALPGLTYVGGWVLTSDEKAFGGLSAVDVLPDGNLLTVSDSGAFVWIGLKDEADFEPETQGSIAYMRGADGKYLTGTRGDDSEGLALKDGLALVSFEREHRVLAFDLEGCGAAARGVLVHDLQPMVTAAGFNISGNSGAEALALAGDDQLLIGIEKRSQYGAALSIGEFTREPSINTYIGNGPRQSLTGADMLPGMNTDSRDLTLYTVHRGYGPIRGNSIGIQETPLKWELRGEPPRNYVPDMSVLPHAYMPGKSRVLAELKSPLTVDNFEGIAAIRRADDGIRIYIISDDNFSSNQRTLLMAFDVIPDIAP